MRTTFLLFIFIFIVVVNSNYCNAQTTYYVSANGSDSGTGSYSSPFQTLEKAYETIPSTINNSYTIILKNDGGPIQVAKNNQPGFTWYQKSGTESNPIHVTSENCFSIITRPAEVKDFPMIRLRETNYITFSNIHFYKGITGTFFFDNTDYSSIRSCKFSGDGSPTFEGATILVGGNNDYSNSTRRSSFNIITNNIIFNQQINAPYSVKHLSQAIYVANFADSNTIFNNTVFDSPAYGIHFWHEDIRSNKAVFNILTQNIGNGVGDRALALGSDYDPSTLTNNQLSDNYVHDQLHTEAVYLSNNLPASNYPSDASEQNGNILYPSLYPSDPYWLAYDPNRIRDKVVTGDFDNDNYQDDIAALYDNGNGTTNIHVWKTDSYSGKAFEYSGGDGKWYGPSYTASQTTGRVVSGDFDHDGKKDDIAAFYDYGNNLTQIHIWTSDWTSNGYSFTSRGAWWSNTGIYAGGYNANKITDRVVSGDFDSDGYWDDIAAFYDNGNSSTNLHVWTSTGSNFTYYWGAGWWGNGVTYDVNKITGRVVSVDFNRDTKVNEIAAFYDLGNGNTRLDVWTLSPNSATHSPGKWTNTIVGAYNANNLTGRVISGKFNNDIYHDDIGGFYKNGAGQTTLQTWTSNGNTFTHSGSSHWWNSNEIGNGYEADNISYRIVSGDFDRNNKTNDIAAFYNYGSQCGSLRTNVWQSTGTRFNNINYTLGYPWLTSWPYTPTYSPISGRMQASSQQEIKVDTIQNQTTQNDLVRIFPNPFDENVTIDTRFTSFGEKGKVSIYSSLGQLIKMTWMPSSGEYSWDGIDDEGYKVKPGMYIIVYENGVTRVSKKVYRIK